MNERLLKVLAESMVLLSMVDDEYSTQEESEFNKWLEKLWHPSYGDFELFLEQIAGHIEDFTSHGISWKDQIAKNAKELYKGLHEKEKGLVLKIMEQFYKCDNKIDPREQELFKIFKDNFKK